MMSQYQKKCEGSCTIGGETSQCNQKVTITVIVHDLTTKRQLRGAGGAAFKEFKAEIFGDLLDFGGNGQI